MDVVQRDQRTELELHVLVRRELVFELGVACKVAPVALADPRGGINGELLFAFEADARAAGEAEDVFRLGLAVELRIVLGVGEACCNKKRRDHNDRARAINVRHFCFPHTPGSRSGNQVAHARACNALTTIQELARMSQCVKQRLEFSSSERF